MFELLPFRKNKCDKIAAMTKKERKAILEGYKSHSLNNEIEILRSQKCGCFFCGKTFNARKVSQWESGTNGGASAICPECGMATVIGDASGVPLTKAVLNEMSQAFYGSEDGEKSPEALNKYIDRYVNGKISQTKKNETLFLHYLIDLANTKDPRAYLLLGDFYSGSAKHQDPDYQLAIAFYSAPLVAQDPYALCRLGVLLYDGHGTKKNKMACFECFSKAAALGSLEAVYRIADCYHYGHPVKPDDAFAFRAVLNGFSQSYSDFLNCHLHQSLLPEFSYRLAKCAQNGWGINKEENFALKYYLICQFSAAAKSIALGIETRTPFLEDINRQIALLGKKIGAKQGEPLYDTDTFFDTYGDPNTPDYSKKKFTFVSYEKETGNLVFELESSRPGLLVDAANLYCGLNKPKIKWSFIDVVSFDYNGESDFDEIVVTDDGYSFLRYGEEEELDTVIAEIHLRQEDDSEPVAEDDPLVSK